MLVVVCSGCVTGAVCSVAVTSALPPMLPLRLPHLADPAPAAPPLLMRLCLCANMLVLLLVLLPLRLA